MNRVERAANARADQELSPLDGGRCAVAPVLTAATITTTVPTIIYITDGVFISAGFTPAAHPSLGLASRDGGLAIGELLAAHRAGLPAAHPSGPSA